MRLPRCAKSGKVGFPSQDEAEARALFIVDFMKREDALRVYRCPDCGRWHMTSRVLPTAMPRQQIVAPQFGRRRA